MWIFDLLFYLLAFIGLANVLICIYPTPKKGWNKKVYDFVDYLSLRKVRTHGGERDRTDAHAGLQHGNEPSDG